MPIMPIMLLALVMFASGGGAAKAAQITLSIPIKIGLSDSVHSQRYSCESGESFSVQYVNARANALAIVPIEGEDRIFVNLVSASGAKYASGTYVWWIKGDSATLESPIEEGSSVNCHPQDTLPLD